jgi:RNA polymerase sigma-70 factor, ECF subfamily
VEALYRTHYDTIYRYVLFRLGSPAAAEDVTSQVFLGMVKGLGRYRDEGKPFVAWLYGIAQKQIAFFQRNQSRSPGSVDLDVVAELAVESAGPDTTTEQRELRAGIVRALSSVPEGQRDVIMLRYFLALSIAETAAVVGRTEGAVKQLQLRGLATLKDILGREGAGPL